MLKQVVTFTPVLLSPQILFLAVVSSCQAATPWKMTCQKLGHTGAKGMVTHRDIPLGLPSRKLVPRFVGPYEIDTIISPAPVWLKLPASWRTPPRFHISQFNPDEGGCIWWTGRVMVRRSVPGFHSHLFWIPV